MLETRYRNIWPLARGDKNMDYNGAMAFISQLGFPIFVSMWMLYKSNKDDAKLMQALNTLEDSVKELITYIHTMKDLEQKQFESNSRILGAIESMGQTVMARYDMEGK